MRYRRSLLASFLVIVLTALLLSACSNSTPPISWTILSRSLKPSVILPASRPLSVKRRRSNMEEKRVSSRKVRVGKVVSDKMDKTVVVIVEDRVALCPEISARIRAMTFCKRKKGAEMETETAGLRNRTSSWQVLVVTSSEQNI